MSITSWTTPKPHIKSTLVKVSQLVIPTLVLVEYVRITVDEKVECGEGRLNPLDIQTWELISQEQFNFACNLFKP